MPEPIQPDDAFRLLQPIADRAADPTSDEAEVMRWIEDVCDTEG